MLFAYPCSAALPLAIRSVWPLWSLASIHHLVHCLQLCLPRCLTVGLCLLSPMHSRRSSIHSAATAASDPRPLSDPGKPMVHVVLRGCP